MKEKPIIFTADSVNAIRDRRKTQTRRVMKVQPVLYEDVWYWPDQIDIKAYGYTAHELNQSIFRYAPYRIGDRLWVKETWRYADWTHDGEPFIAYASDCAERLIETIPDEWSERVLNIWADLSDRDNYNIDFRAADRKWRSPIFMPRWASRITLEVTAVCVERLRDITEADAQAEGVAFCQVLPTALDHKCVGRLLHEQQGGSSFAGFYKAWETINGKRSPWSQNDWVWVYEFKPLEVNE